ncbi:DUF7281 domain-containing protein [Halomonas stenophila]|uniref:DUF7281 domain-containing protein n=1 Tax=Halomonas stenophila TaxID=795312 RepID=A0A7W5EV13_9GAMM|nr:hypothetical protein [Halomonas stenophila]MBB3231962.1 hypothetical protein [Halomonas stenophila]
MIPLSTLQRTLQRRPASVTLSPMWLSTHAELGVGTPNGRKLLLSENDLELLEAEYRRQTNDASLGFDLTQDRVAVSAQLTNEKASQRQVFGGFIRISSSDGIIHFSKNNGEICLPPGSYLSLREGDMLEISEYDRVLIIENGALMENIEAMMEIVPEKFCHDTLYVYRGNDASQNKVFELMKNMPGSVSLGLFFDYDPAGLSLAQTGFISRHNGPVSIIVPRDIEVISTIGRGDVYMRQLEIMDRLRNSFNENAWIGRHVMNMVKHKRVLMQEAMLSRKIKLTEETVRR